VKHRRGGGFTGRFRHKILISCLHKRCFATKNSIGNVERDFVAPFKCYFLPQNARRFLCKHGITNNSQIFLGLLENHMEFISKIQLFKKFLKLFFN